MPTTITHSSRINSNMENTDGLIKVFLAGKLPQEKYTDMNEFAQDLANVLAINKANISVELIALESIKGDKGDKGDRGNQGQIGPTGLQGATGPAGSNGTGLTWLGVWALTVNYSINDLVDNGGVVYICKSAHEADANSEPGIGASWTTYWDVYPLEIVITGVTDGSAPPAGAVGESLDSIVLVGSAVALTDATAKDITTLVVTEGEWDIYGQITFIGAGATATELAAGVGIAADTLPGSDVHFGGILTTTSNFSHTISIAPKRLSITGGPATMHLVAKATFSAGTVTGHGRIEVRRRF